MFETQVGHQLRMEWKFPYFPEFNISNETAYLHITNDAGINLKELLAPDDLHIERRSPDEVTVFALIDTTYFVEGDLTYDVRVRDANGADHLNETGIIRVTAQVDPAPEPEVLQGRLPWDRDIEVAETVSVEVSDARLATCTGCPFFDTNVCTDCGCYMPLKVTLLSATCPQSLWAQ